MTTWTVTAQRELEEHLAGLRLALAGSGADPDEVLEDVRRHVAEEASAARLPVVTEADVRQFLSRVAPLSDRSIPRQDPFTPHEPPTSPNQEPPDQPSPSARSPLSPLPWWRRLLIGFFGVLVPIATLIFEAITRFCAKEVFDPMPTFWHGLLVGLVPAANAWGLMDSSAMGPKGRRARWLMNSAAIGIAAVYTVLFLPMAPFALLGVIIGLGLLPLAPVLGLVCALSLRWRMAREHPGLPVKVRQQGWVALVLPMLFLIGGVVPTVWTRHQAGIAARDDAGRSDAAVKWLRRWGDHDVLLRECYGFRPGLWDGFLPAHLPAPQAQQLYFRVTGQPFNAVTPPSTAWSRSNRGWIDDLEAGGVEWDSALGSEAVAGRVRGLSMVSSRVDAMADADAAWSYVEWTLEFRNDHEWSQREARAQIQLPPGGVVSRLTLWVNGEEREAAFAGRGQVREAYQQIAVQERRDPVLVTTSGPDRVLMQCFPVPPRGGTMKVRLGITSPLALNGSGEAVMVWPGFLERNFGQSRSLTHGIWLDAAQEVSTTPDGLSAVRNDRDRVGWRGEWTDAALAEPGRAIVLKRSAASTEHWAPDRRSSGGGFVRQRLVSMPARPLRRVALVLDASVGMDGVLGEVAGVLERLPAGPEVGVFVVQDGVTRLAGDGRGAEAASALRRIRCEGGQDSVPGLEAAWDWAADVAGSAVIWVHASNPVLLRPVESLRQRFERQRGDSAPQLWDLPVRHGPNRVIEKLDGLEAVGSIPRLGNVSSDLERWIRSIEGREPRWQWVRERLESQPASAAAQALASTHVTRLWALGEVRKLGRTRKVAEATSLAAAHQLVTPYSGAVVLETQQQYERTGLQPVDPGTVPVVPEPGAGWLLLFGALVLLARRRPRSRVTTGASSA
jgi:hypothetical protein